MLPAVVAAAAPARRCPLRPSCCTALSYPAARSMQQRLLSGGRSSDDGGRRVCGMVVLHRHGERAPMVNFYRSDDAQASAAEREEEQRWLARLPSPEELARLNAHFPVRSAASRVPRDRRSKPFGCLTQRGLDGMRRLGRSLRELHPTVLQPSTESGGGAGVAFEVYSSNFARTQQSAQGLLHGLGAHELAAGPADEGEGTGPLGAGAAVPVVVREERECTIHMYDNDPHTIQHEVGKVLRDPSFLARQGEQEALKADLVRLVPGLTADNFKWMEAADFFWCQPRDSDLELGPQLEALRDPTVEYVAWRFQQYYAHRPLLALVIAPLVHEVLGTLQRMAGPGPTATATASGRVAVFSGHDVTVLAFLHALGWPRVQDPTWWPPYGCALVFELLEPAGSAAATDSPLDYRVRIRLEMMGQHVPISLPVLGEQPEREDATISLGDLGRWMEEQGLLLARGAA